MELRKNNLFARHNPNIKYKCHIQFTTIFLCLKAIHIFWSINNQNLCKYVSASMYCKKTQDM